MIRFIDLGKQVGIDEDWPREFAFYCTVRDVFLSIHSNQTWESWDELFDDCCSEKLSEDYISRLKGLCQKWVFHARRENND
jgi:hypothetical protein